MKKVLMIAFQYPPYSGSSGIQRTLGFSRYLPSYGWQPIILTAQSKAYPDLQQANLVESSSNGIVVKRAFGLDAARHLSIRGSYCKWLALPDRWISWWLGAVPAGLRLIRKFQPDVLWSTYPIATAHLIGLTLHRLSGIPWMADFRDPMADTDPKTGIEYPLDPEIRRANLRIERFTIERCSRAVFTTPTTLRVYAERYPRVPARQLRLIENGYDEEIFVKAEREERTGSSFSRTVLLHSGALQTSIRDPRVFFDALADLQETGLVSPQNLRIILRGSGNEDIYRRYLLERGIESLVSLEPSIPYIEALKEMLRADGLLIFQASNCNLQIPAKIYEYFRAQKPVFAMTDPDGDTAAVLRGAGIGTIAPLDSREEMIKGLRNFLEQVRCRRAPVPGDQDLQAYSRNSRTAELARLLNELIESDGKEGSHA